MPRYQIRVIGRSRRAWADWFREMQVQTTGEGGQEQPDRQALPELLLTGDLPDQSALLGVLMRLHNLNLTLLSFQTLPDNDETGPREV